ncbi:uncharacterized protein LOC124205782 [Daphnia pulex]|uniref:uncharacterized protein LOC124205782 n=1 Tax=Daphnia pulex TaxID=6669 RepID=UPI001EDD47BF|nr:uncharacterized protein LOC124205782 [Daphnia pulex]
MNQNSLIGVNLRRTLMLSPGQQEIPPKVAQGANRTEMELGVSEMEKTDQAFMKVSFERYISQILSSTELEAHEERLKKINEEAHNLSKDEWMYPSIEKLLGNWSQ